MNKQKISYLTRLSLLTAILVVLGFTPIGSIQLPVVKATTTHIPVILGALLLGWKAGAFLGSAFGVVSVLRSTLFPNITSFVFSPFVPMPGTGSGSLAALIVAFVPRICIGLAAQSVYLFLRRLNLRKGMCYAISAVAGSMVNTVFVLALIALFFAEPYAQALGIAGNALFGSLMLVVQTNGIGEAIAAAVLVCAIMLPLDKILKRSDTL